MKKILQEPNKLKILADRLSKIKEISRFNHENHNESWVIAHSFSGLEHSFNKFLESYLPRLVDENLSDQEVNDLLIEIGEELRHIIYHIRDPDFLKVYTEEIREGTDA